MITIAEQKEKDALKARWLEEKGPAIKVMQEYLSFCQVNSLQDDEDSVLALFSSWRCSGRVATTIYTSMRHLRTMLHEYRIRGPICMEIPSVEALLRMAAVDAARFRGRHAVDLDIETLEEALVSAPSSRLRAFFCFLTVTGLRGCDLAEIQGALEISVGSHHLAVDIGVTKNRRNPESKALLRITDACGLLWRPRLMALLREDRQFLSGLTSSYKSDVRGLSTFFQLYGRKDVSFEKATSYTLRRNFCHRVILLCTRSDGTVDWERAIQFTLHKRPATLAAAYAKRAQEIAS